MPPAGAAPSRICCSARSLAAFASGDADANAAFVARPNGKWLCDLYLLARMRLHALGVERIAGGEFCTYGERERFYSYRRERNTGRMASLIWIV